MSLLVLLSKRGRLDGGELLSGMPGDWFKTNVLGGAPFRVAIFDEWLKSSNRYDGVSRIIATGAKCLDAFRVGEYGYTTFAPVPTIVTHDISDAYDFKPEDEDEDAPEDKDKTPTRHRNKLYWIDVHCKKLLNSEIRRPPSYPTTTIYPSAQSIIDYLNSTPPYIVLDLEATRRNARMDCIGLGDSSHVFVLPIYRYNGTLAYDIKILSRIFKALYAAFCRGSVAVIHNSMFDLLYLAFHYRLPPPPLVFDTQLAQHRISPETEKSLGHAVAQWTWFPYHKNELVIPHTRDAEQRLWNYNAKDIATSAAVYEAQVAYAKTVPGLSDSIAWANRMIRPFLLNTLQGLRLDEAERVKASMALSLEAKQTLRMMKILAGTTINPSSPKSLSSFFYDELGYSVLLKTNKGQPSTDKKAMQKLLLKYKNPLLALVLRHRKAQHSLSMLGFKNWKL